MFPLAYAAVVVVVAAAETVVRIRNNRKFKGSESWPLTQSTVDLWMSAQPAVEDRATSYSGFCRCQFHSEKAAREFVETLRGKTITVQYNAEACEVSVVSGP